MIKLIIFDIDNTLIDIPMSIKVEFQKLLDKFNTGVSAMDLYEAVGTYETNKEGVYYTKEKLLEVVNRVLKLNLNMDFVNEFFNVYDKLISPLDDGVVDTLKYLKNKYRIVALSNWFTDSQKSRLKEAKILEYFDEIYGTDIVPMKPRIESFMSIIGDLKPEECVMIGDNLEVDIKVPYEIGMNVYHLNKFGNSKYPTIKKIEDLKERL